MFIPGGEPTPKTGAKVELTQKEAQRISGEIMEKVEKDLGSWVNNRLPLKYDPITYGGIMVLLDTVLQRITFFGGLYYIHSLGLTQNPQTARSLLESHPETIERLLEPKSEIAACVAFLYHACSHQEVGNDMKKNCLNAKNSKI